MPIAYLTYGLLFFPVVLRAFIAYTKGESANDFTFRLRDVVDDILTILDGNTDFEIVRYDEPK